MQDPKDSDERNPNGPTAKAIKSLVAKGLTQKAIAAHMEMPEARLSRWANGMGVRLCDDAIKLHELDRVTKAKKPKKNARRKAAEHQPETT